MVCYIYIYIYYVLPGLIMIVLFTKLICIDPTAPSKVVTPVASPTLTTSGLGLRISWTPPYSEYPITVYQIQYRSKTPTWSTASTSSTTYQVSNLTIGAWYDFRVRAISDAGEGPWSNVAQGTTYNGEWSKLM